MKYLIAANWKMNGSKDFIESYLSVLDIKDNSEVKMLICPPDCYLGDINSNELKQLNDIFKMNITSILFMKRRKSTRFTVENIKT